MKKYIRKLLAFSLICIVPLLLVGQVDNDECVFAEELIDLENWCSDVGAYNIAQATQSVDENPSCWPFGSETNDMWFKFTSFGNQMSIAVRGSTNANPGGTLFNPQVAIYSGTCNALIEIACNSVATGPNVSEVIVNNLTIGQTYYIRVDARNNNVGTFQLCLNVFNAVPDPESDCADAVLLCDKSPFTVESVNSTGNSDDDLSETSCLNVEYSSTWYKWVCDESGTLTFTLTPNNPSDDLDFVLFELPDGLDDCDNKMELRCMASGENVGAPLVEWQICVGPTGLSTSESDVVEMPGCNNGSNNFIAALDMVSGRSYALMVMNFTNNGNGFAIEFGGTGTFLGPEADFAFDPPDLVECDQEMTVFDLSTFDGNIVGYTWSFGSGAIPPVANGIGPHDVTYESFGEKLVALTVETERGCLITKVKELYIEKCCKDYFLEVNVEDTRDLTCFGDGTGIIDLEGDGENNPFEYSLNGIDFQKVPSFSMLDAGDYTIYIQDTKGCLDSTTAEIIQPPELMVDAGPDQTVELGYGTTIEATVKPTGTFVSWSWIDVNGTIECDTCQSTFVKPLTTTTYTIIVTDEDGCEAEDEVTIFVNAERPVYIPNVFTPNNDGINDKFNISTDISAAEVELMRVYDRWGAMVYEGRTFPPNNPNYGWDGKFRGLNLNPGVFAYYIVVRFIDDKSFPYEGDISLLR